MASCRVGSYLYTCPDAKFLSRRQMRRLPTDSDKRKNKIIGRCNWYMFGSSTIRGDKFQDSHDFFVLCKTAAANCPPEQEKPNQWITDNNHLSLQCLSKYHKEYPRDSSSWLIRQDIVPADQIQEVLVEAWERWQAGNERTDLVAQAIDNIPMPERITKVVCLGLGSILKPLSYAPNQERNTVSPNNLLLPRNIAQHIAAIAIVKQLEKKTGQRIPLYTADPEYGVEHKKALEALPVHQFIVLDPSYGKHEQFTIIDDSTMLFDMTGPPQCPTLRIIQEFARPVAIITREIPREGKFQDRLWFEVTEDDGNKVQIPGCWDLPFPDGCANFVGLCPKRVRDMMVYEYDIEEKFPAESEKYHRTWGVCDLVDYQHRDKKNSTVGGYWFSNTRERPAL
ncbi:hypothetical protein F4677DRAFT_457755 [Hypoxylon crocopeplum]|nr:hypothetical protein F4677DRAFT_457755 [Hypoxylon crocopeplum]